MRELLTSAAILLAAPAFADRFELDAPVREAVLYPQGASVTRIARTELPEGAHELVIPGLPPGTSPDSLRVSAEGAGIGAVSLQRGRALPDSSADPDAIAAARQEVRRLERSLRAHDAEAELIAAEAETARDMVAFLKDLARSDSAGSGDVNALADMVGARILAARRSAIEAETRAFAAAQGRGEAERALENARQRLEALEQPPSDDRATLVIAVNGQGGPATLRITGHVDAASWAPVYDLRLDQEAGSLTLERGLLVSQSSGEDWSDVALTLSTSRPAQRSAPSELSPHRVRIYDPEDPVRPVYAETEMMAADMAGGALMKQPSPVADAARTEFMGATAIYRYDSPVDLRDGVDDLRLSLDRQDMPIEALVAEAVPARDSTAYLVADTENPLQEAILPGPATLYADGAMVGRTRLDLTAAGDEMKIGFGAIDGIMLERRLPDRQSGDMGLIRRSAALDETAILSAENLTGRDYRLRMIDRVPVSEQEALTVDWTASVPPDETDPDGKRGLLVWEMPLNAGQRQEITLTTSLRWPEDMELAE
ncbi:DUF4139 domain-containing protein [Paracoccus sediminicola]|uniref:DUF4139 domain-containing protein n=1 Tax=Paracoccus sediminicola TaxID=3017783 RepID=UPI0022F0059A|nr:DUF4139 domain-containing protein [Paracoccus sediminicola]WBU57569.1 DUF4139 domain-containing protein [Paracoccus sediminicola]